MSTSPRPIEFLFLSNNFDPDDMSGVAKWLVPKWEHGEWTRQPFELTFKTFKEAHMMHNIVLAAMEAAEADGYAKCEARVLNALKG